MSHHRHHPGLTSRRRPGAGVTHAHDDELRNVLIGLCRRDAHSAAGSLRHAVTSSPDRLGALLDLAGRHRLTGLAVDVLASGPLPGGGHASNELAELRQAVTRRSAALWTLHLEALEALVRAGLRPVLLKGGAVSRFYASSHQREMADLDILLPREQLTAAERSLSKLGYRFPFDDEIRTRYMEHHFHLPVRRGVHYVELHWDLIHPDSPFHLSPDLCFDGHRSSPLPQLQDVCVPPPEVLVLHLILQSAQEGFVRLSRLVDLDRILAGAGAADFPWKRLASSARDGGISHAAYLALSLSSDWLDTPVPRDLLDDLRPSWFTRRHLALLLPGLFLPSPSGGSAPDLRLLLTLWLLPGPVLRGSYLRAVLKGDTAEDRFRTHRPGLAGRLSLTVRALGRQLRLYGSLAPFRTRAPFHIL